MTRSQCFTEKIEFGYARLSGDDENRTRVQNHLN